MSNPSINSKPRLSRFSYSELTQLQVNGARDRSQRQMEKAQWELQWKEANEKWHRAVESIRRKRQETDIIIIGSTIHEDEEVQRRRKEVEELQLFQEAVKQALQGNGNNHNDNDNKQDGRSQRLQQLSSFLLTRLAVVLRKEYHSRILEKALEGLYQEQNSLVNWVCQVVQIASDEKKDALAKHQHMRQQTNLQQETDRLEYLLRCQHLLQMQRQEILQLLNLKMEMIRQEDLRGLVVVQRPSASHESRSSNAYISEHDIAALPSPASSKWLEEILVENYFPSQGSASPATTATSTAPSLSPVDSDGSNSNNNNNNNNASDWVLCGY